MFGLMLFSLSAVLMPDSPNTGTIEVFYKQMEPSLQTLAKVDSVLARFEDQYTIQYYVITDSSSQEIIQRYNLPETHFPFAVVVNGNYTATINGELISFVHFPLFMHGIGRHEGNWSMETLEQVLADNSLLNGDNTLPVLDESGETTGCKEE